MATPNSFKRSICRSAGEVMSGEDRLILTLVALNYSREIEKESGNDKDTIDQYYDFLKEQLFQVQENVVKPSEVNLDLVLDDEHKKKEESNMNYKTASPTKSIDDVVVDEKKEVKDVEAQEEKPEEKQGEKHSTLKEYDWDSALSNKVEESPVVDKKSLKVSPIPDAILYGNLEAYGIPNIERIKLYSQMGDISSENPYDQVYDLGSVPRSFKLGNREVVQHVDVDDTATQVEEKKEDFVAVQVEEKKEDVDFIV